MISKLVNSILFVIILTCGLQGHVLRKPHIIFVLVDDWGWYDVGFHGTRGISTPNIDALASDGIILNNYYSFSTCTPSRAALLTGVYPTTSGMHSLIAAPQDIGIPLDIKTLPERLKPLGYINRMIGKWHVGYSNRNYTPTQRGFDSHYGFWTGSVDFYSHRSTSDFTRDKGINVPESDPRQMFLFDGKDFRDNWRVVYEKEGEYLTDVYTKEAKRLIRHHNASKPLFLYLAHHGVHRGNFLEPMTVPEKYSKQFGHISDSERRAFAGSLKAVDDSIGEVVKELRNKDMLRDSIIVISSDNGAPVTTRSTRAGGSNWPLRGDKGTAFEGGIKAVGLIWGTMLKKSRYEWPGFMHIADWMPTLYHAAGGNVSELGELNSHDMWEVISENGVSPRRDSLVAWDFKFESTAVRYGDFKLIAGISKSEDASKWIEPLDYGMEYDHIQNDSDSLTYQALKDLYKNTGKPMAPKVISKIKCGPRPKPSNESWSCDLSKGMCLFNVKDDPCEFKNIINIRPDVKAYLFSTLQEYHRTSVPPRNPPYDYLSNPELHNGTWEPWLNHPIISLNN